MAAAAMTVSAEGAGEVSFTRDRIAYLVRAIRASDRPALVEAFDHLSEASRYSRFLRPIKHLATDEARFFTEVDHRNHEALVAFAPGGELVGVARYIRLEDDPRRAEVAITVADEWQQRGVGSHLLHELAGRAIEAGVDSFVGICLVENHRMLDLVRELGPHAKTRSVGDGTTEFEVELPTDGPKALGAALSAAARHSKSTSPSMTERRESSDEG
jgi:RimJ/RimL family protein N-acetyltransferase